MSAWGLLAGIVPALISWALIARIRDSAWAARLVDRPNERSLHSVPTPRVGGLGVMAGALPFAFLLGDEPIHVVQPEGAIPFWDLLRRKAQLLPS